MQGRVLEAPTRERLADWYYQRVAPSTVQRGELWRSPSTLRDRVVLLVTSQTLIDNKATMLTKSYGLAEQGVREQLDALLRVALDL